MASDFSEDLAHEAGRPGIQPEEGDLVSFEEFKRLLRVRLMEERPMETKDRYSWERKTPLSEEDIVDRAAHSQNVYQGPLLDEPEVEIPRWAIVTFLTVFVAGVGFLVWLLQ
jgi:hypothetical protein